MEIILLKNYEIWMIYVSVGIGRVSLSFIDRPSEPKNLGNTVSSNRYK